MVVNNVELPDIDIADADVAEKYENIIAETTDAINAVNTKTQKRSESIRGICNAIFNAFNDLFGDGTAKKIFGSSVNLTTCINAYSELIDNVNELDRKAGESIKNAFNTKYASQNPYKHKNKKKYNHYKPKLKAKQ